jgi:hypothetical protein
MPRRMLTIERKFLFTAVLLLLTVAGVTIGTKRGPLIELYDFGEHAASIREMSDHLLSPANPLLATDGTTTLRYTPYIFILGLFKRVGGVQLFTVIQLASLVSFLLLLTGVYVWGKAYFRDEAMPLYILIALLFLWGKSFDYSNEYSFRFLTYSLFYPSTVTFNLSFLGLYFVLIYARSENLRFYFLYLCCAVFIFLTHPLTASFFLLGAGLHMVTEGDKRLKHAALFGVSVLIILASALLWPYHPFWKAVISSTTTDWYYPFRMYLYDTRNIYRMGPALLGLPVVFFFLLKKKYAFISLGFCLCASIYVLSYLVNIRLGERYIFFTMVFLHLALAWYLCALDIASLKTLKGGLAVLSEKNLHILFFALIALLSICYQLSKLGFEQAGQVITFKPRPMIAGYTNPLDDYFLLQGTIAEGDIVLSDPLTSWLLPAFTGAKIVSLYHNNPLVPDNDRRVADAARFYHPATPREERKRIVNAYRATHILLNFDRMNENEVNRINDYHLHFRIDQRLVGDVQSMGETVFETKDLILVKISHHPEGTERKDAGEPHA